MLLVGAPCTAHVIYPITRTVEDYSHKAVNLMSCLRICWQTKVRLSRLRRGLLDHRLFQLSEVLEGYLCQEFGGRADGR